MAERSRRDGARHDHVERMWAQDRASAALGMELLAVADGSAEVAMTITASMVNGHRIAHGGLIATLADSTFALACNAGGRTTVAQGFAIDFFEPVRLGERLVATAVEQTVRGRTGIYDVTVRRGETVVALFRGRSRALSG